MSLQSCSLQELNERIREVLTNAFQGTVWVRAEISEVRENASGHCYLELVEKDEKGDTIVAKMKAAIWANVYRILKPYFEQCVGNSLTAGMKILVACTIEFHEVYGLSLTISDIDPTYTIGEVALRRQQIFQQLENEGIATMNKELEFALLPQRIAIISSETAAGYGDFLHQLAQNSYQFCFYTKLFPAAMQGDKAEQSVIEALDAVFSAKDQFDAVAIIRGGGATADLSCFDRYLLAAHCAQFPLPILTGIGHQRDETVLDLVAYESLKTPTAVAEYLIDGMYQAYSLLTDATEELHDCLKSWQQNELQRLNTVAYRFPQLLTGKTTHQRVQLATLIMNLKYTALQTIQHAHIQNLNNKKALADKTKWHIYAHANSLQKIEQKFQYINPQTLLQKGYTLTYHNGKRATGSKQLQPGDKISTVFHDGQVESKVTEQIFTNGEHLF